MQLVILYSNITKKKRCWVCNNLGYIIKNNTIYHCDQCEAGYLSDDSTLIQNPISEYFNVEDLITENQYVAKYN